MQLDEASCYRAVKSRDRRFEGRFVVAVRSTGIYCRPGCPAPIPKRRNVLFYRVAAAAEEAGFRPCKRCRPDASPDAPAWLGTSATVRRALRLIAEAGLPDGVEGLADRLGIGARHLRRLFAGQVGASPIAVAQTRRLHFAKKLLEETNLPMSQVADASGFASVRRFNDAMQGTFRSRPTELRRARGAGRDAPGSLVLRLPYKGPLDWAEITAFLRARATPGVEEVSGGVYRRTFAMGGSVGILEVAALPRDSALRLTVSASGPTDLYSLVERVRSLFDLGADPDVIVRHLARDARLRKAVGRRPGLRVPGAWDPFEVSVRAILGQQVSVAGATTLAGKLARAHGEPLAARGYGDPSGRLTHLFPTPAKLATAKILGLPRARAEALDALAREVHSGALEFDAARDLDATVARLRALPGVGPWTAHYVAMRALHEPDAFPSGDLVLRRAIRPGACATTRELEARAEAWRPFRAYAAMHLWAASSQREE